jgi:hypothetical protein
VTTHAELLSQDTATLVDLATFADLEWTTRDVEPWADLIRELYASKTLSLEQALWVLYLYNAYDDFGSAWTAFTRWESPRAWASAPDRDDAADLPIMQERRNLLGGRMLYRHASYAHHLAGETQVSWLSDALDFGVSWERNWTRMLAYTRQVWGVGRQASFEWTEFIAKVARWPLAAPDACLWESSGPRESLERLYRNDHPDRDWLELAAHACLSFLNTTGVPLTWVDFETVICDFNVMRKGRYYVGKHLAALSAEIDSAPAEDRPALRTAWRAVIPAPWSDIPPGVDKSLHDHYRRTGQVLALMET